MMSRKLKIAVTDYWNTDLDQNYLYSLLKPHYDFELSDSPDILFFSVFGNDHLKYDCLKIQCIGENIRPNFHLCDYAFSFDETDTRNFQLPLFMMYPFFGEMRSGDYGLEVQSWRDTPKSSFCNFIFQNGRARERIHFCQQLMKYKWVDCPGEILNNRPSFDGDGDKWMEKLSFMKDYKFTVAFENASSVNYTTEKIFHALLVGSIPIYWGNPEVSTYFNPASFINCHDYSSFDDVIARVKEIDNNPELYHQYVSAPPLLPTSRCHSITEEAIVDRFDSIVQNLQLASPVSRTFAYKFTSLSIQIDACLRKTKRRCQAFVVRKIFN
ncbi:alpha-(1,3)-fucosyltransferase FucT [Abditibacteriota bacterium]|nr:alpha-(1,3)-fucosyltransferase FucT [Abditibacteriota bacterium]